jgi:5-methylcytosine-specific restriction endonuclease McrA
MDAATRELVRRRAGDCCEYCRLKQEDLPFAVFQVEHIVARKHGGDDDPANLALACERCNAHKGTNLSGIDSETGEINTLFHPRRQAWRNISGALVSGSLA